MNPEEVDIDYYSVLGVGRDATEVEIKKQYHKYAKAFHPDKSASENKELAVRAFNDIREAYEVLSNQRTRDIYDRFGVEGVREASMQLSSPLQREEFMRLFTKMKAVLEEKELEAKLGHQNSTVAFFNASDLLNSTPDEVYVPYLHMYRVNQQFRIPLGHQDSVTLGTKMSVFPFNQKGNTEFSAHYEHHFTNGITSNTGVSLSTCTISPSSVRLVLRHVLARKLVRKYGIIGYKAHLYKNQSSLQLGWTEKLKKNRFFRGVLGMGNKSSLKLLISNQNDEVDILDEAIEPEVDESTLSKLGWLFGINLTNSSFSFDGGLNYLSGLRTVFKLHGNVGSELQRSAFTPQFSVNAAIERKISALMVVGVGVQVSMYGVACTFSITRGSQTFSLPIKVSNTLSVGSILFGALTPLLTSWATKAFWLDPRRDKLEAARKEKEKEERKLQVEEAKRKAMEKQELMRQEVERKKEEETNKKGILIVVALYGAMTDDMIKQAVDLDLDVEKHSEVIEVTDPVQFMVERVGENSFLKMPQTSKSQLPGFYDPCPGESKVLVVVYMFRDQTHTAVVKDEEALNAPMKGHLVH